VSHIGGLDSVVKRGEAVGGMVNVVAWVNSQSEGERSKLLEEEGSLLVLVGVRIGNWWFKVEDVFEEDSLSVGVEVIVGEVGEATAYLNSHLKLALVLGYVVLLLL